MKYPIKVKTVDKDFHRTLTIRKMQLEITFTVKDVSISTDDIGERGWIPQEFVEEFCVADVTVFNARLNAYVAVRSAKLREKIVEILEQDSTINEEVYDYLTEKIN